MADKKQDKKQETKQASPPPAQKKDPVSPIPAEISIKMDEIMRRIRLLEERYSQVRKKSQFTEENMLNDTKEIFNDINVLNETIAELKTSIAEIGDKLFKLGEEVSQGVSKAELNVISKYLDFWQPLDFVTRQEVEKMLREKK